LQDGGDYLVNGDAVHTAEIDRAYPAEARGTGSLGFEQAMPGVPGNSWTGQFWRRAAKRDDNRYAQGGSDVHRASVIGQQDAAQGKHGAEIAQ
jgi:hypothetical protein